MERRRNRIFFQRSQGKKYEKHGLWLAGKQAFPSTYALRGKRSSGRNIKKKSGAKYIKQKGALQPNTALGQLLQDGARVHTLSPTLLLLPTANFHLGGESTISKGLKNVERREILPLGTGNVAFYLDNTRFWLHTPTRAIHARRGQSGQREMVPP